MRIVVINGQNHKGSSWQMGQRFLAALGGTHTVTEFFLPRDLNHFCTGCCACLKARENCPYYADKKPLYDAISAADLLVLTTPTYCMLPSAPMKSFLDLFFTNWMTHKPFAEMFDKQAVVFSAAAGAGAKKAAKGVATNLKNWGIPRVKIYGKSIHAFGWDTIPAKEKAKIERDIARLAVSVAKRPPRVGLQTKCLFRLYGGMQKAGFGAAPEEKEYWQNRGWLDGKAPCKA